MPVLRLPKFGLPVKYAYITGRGRAMKTKLIPAEMYARMMNMEMAEIARYLEETQFKDEIDAFCAENGPGAEPGGNRTPLAMNGRLFDLILQAEQKAGKEQKPVNAVKRVLRQSGVKLDL